MALKPSSALDHLCDSKLGGNRFGVSGCLSSISGERGKRELEARATRRRYKTIRYRA